MLPARLEAARLPCFATGTPAPATTKAAAVEMLKVSAPSPPVPQVSTARGSGQGSWRARARAARAAATISPTVSPLVRSATSSAAHSRSDPPPSMISPKAASSSGAGTSRPSIARSTASRRLMRPLRRAHGSRKRREQRLAHAGQDRLGVELDAFDRQLAVAHAHDLAVRGARRDLRAPPDRTPPRSPASGSASPRTGSRGRRRARGRRAGSPTALPCMTERARTMRPPKARPIA